MKLFTPKKSEEKINRQEKVDVGRHIQIAQKAHRMALEARDKYKKTKAELETKLNTDFSAYLKKKDEMDGEIAMLEERKRKALEPIRELEKETERKHENAERAIHEATELMQDVHEQMEGVEKKKRELEQVQNDVNREKATWEKQLTGIQSDVERMQAVLSDGKAKHDQYLKEAYNEAQKLDKERKQFITKQAIFDKEKEALANREKKIQEKEEMLNRWQARLVAHENKL